MSFVMFLSILGIYGAIIQNISWTFLIGGKTKTEGFDIIGEGADGLQESGEGGGDGDGGKSERGKKDGIAGGARDILSEKNRF